MYHLRTNNENGVAGTLARAKLERPECLRFIPDYKINDNSTFQIISLIDWRAFEQKAFDLAMRHSPALAYYHALRRCYVDPEPPEPEYKEMIDRIHKYATVLTFFQGELNYRHWPLKDLEATLRAIIDNKSTVLLMRQWPSKKFLIWAREQYETRKSFNAISERVFVLSDPDVDLGIMPLFWPDYAFDSIEFGTNDFEDKYVPSFN